MVKILAGITQVAPAWKAVRFEPCFVPEIHRVRALIPSPQGDLIASWQRDDRWILVELQLPSSMTAEIQLPGHQRVITGDTVFHAEIKVA
ncbi:MAG: alpha-L-rhamnosidase C-terminal domain-containing protein [Verrucomicrobiia bacterium]